MDRRSAITVFCCRSAEARRATRYRRRKGIAAPKGPLFANDTIPLRHYTPTFSITIASSILAEIATAVNLSGYRKELLRFSVSERGINPLGNHMVKDLLTATKNSLQQ
jgi:hypothetical protein